VKGGKDRGRILSAGSGQKAGEKQVLVGGRAAGGSQFSRCGQAGAAENVVQQLTDANSSGLGGMEKTETDPSRKRFDGWRNLLPRTIEDVDPGFAGDVAGF